MYTERLKRCLPGKRVSSIIDCCVLARVCAFLVCVCVCCGGGAGLGRPVASRLSQTDRPRAARRRFTMLVCACVHVHWAQHDQR